MNVSDIIVKKKHSKFDLHLSEIEFQTELDAHGEQRIIFSRPIVLEDGDVLTIRYDNGSVFRQTGYPTRVEFSNEDPQS